jgi:ATP-dependent Clp protease ATP-binding subunit ClpC
LFERFTEKARRVIFFARYEASQYGSPYIEAEFLLLGLLRENEELLRKLLQKSNIASDVRVAVENHIPPRERITTSVEVPLTEEAKQALILAMEEADRLGHDNIDTAHLLRGILDVKDSFAASLLLDRGVEVGKIRDKIAKGRPNTTPKPSTRAVDSLRAFLASLKSDPWV